MSDAEKAVADKVFGDNSPEELTADAVQAADAINRGVMPEPKAAPEPKPGGAVAAEPGSVPEPTADPAKPAAVDPAAPAEPVVDPAAPVDPAEPVVDPAVDPNAPVDPAAVVDPAKPVDPVPPNPEEDKDAIRVRLRRDSFETETDWKVAQKAMDFIRAGMTPAKAEAAAKEHLGIKADAPAPVDAPPTPEVEALQTVTQQLEAKEAERDAALLAYDNEKVVALNKEIKTLSTEQRKAEKAAETAQAAQVSYQASIQRSIAEFPESNVKGSKLYKAIAGRFATMDADDPLWQNPNRAEIVAKEEAEGLGIKGKSASAATAPLVTPAKAPAATKPQKVSPVPGSARTTTPTLTPDAALDAELKKAMGKNAHVLSTIS